MNNRDKTALSLALAIVGGIAAGMRCDASVTVETPTQTNPRVAAYTVKAYTEGTDPFDALQDYYGHGVSWKKERARRRRRGKVEYYYTIIGRPFGDPDTTNPTEATIMKPSSYAGKWGHSEHGPIWAPEPGNLRFATQRRNAAIDKTKQELSKWLPNWCRDCACLFLKSLGY